MIPATPGRVWVPTLEPKDWFEPPIGGRRFAIRDTPLVRDPGPAPSDVDILWVVALGPGDPQVLRGTPLPQVLTRLREITQSYAGCAGELSLWVAPDGGARLVASADVPDLVLTAIERRWGDLMGWLSMPEGLFDDPAARRMVLRVASTLTAVGVVALGLVWWLEGGG